jgi:HAD superfamily hydrolase (TIGR01509 family)
MSHQESSALPEFTPIKAVIFDWDFTLVDSGFRTAVRAFDDAAHLLKGAKIEQSHIAAVGELRQNKVKEAISGLYYNLVRPKLNDGAKPLIEKLLDKDIPVLIISNAPDVVLQEKVVDLLGEELVSKLHIYGDQPHHPRKPDCNAYANRLK